ncbi:MAG: membrane dipeptidase [Polyangiaceae bacterium]|nr:membrane dipeptidase [Polyangiaceae bacterium]
MTTYPIVDLHSHYPMHLRHPDVYDGPLDTLAALIRNDVRDTARALVMKAARRLFSDESATSGPSISVPHYRHGGVEVAFSALYSPFDELFARGRLFGPPVEDDFPTLLDQMRIVEESVDEPFSRAVIARNMSEVVTARDAGKVALIHCVEGGFHLGSSASEIDANVRTLKSRGVAYITVAHLFYRGIARNTAALPFLPDAVYHALFRQPDVGLTPLGEALIRAMHRERVLVDVTHMSARAMDDTFELLDRLDAGTGAVTPVIASHGACRFGTLDYNLEERHVKELGRRGGVIGVIVCDHYAGDGILQGRSRTFEESARTIARHVERICTFTSSEDHVAIGSDHDGFIKPTLAGLAHPGDLQRLAHAIEAELGAAVAEKMASTNV